MASNVTLSDLRSYARERADMVNSTFISDSELTDYINESLLELYDLLVQKFGDEYYHTVYRFDISSSATMYPLPTDFYKLKGVDLATDSGTPGRFVTLYPFMLNERNRYAYSASSLPSRTVQLRYVPRAKRLTADTQTFTSSDVSAANDTITESDHQYSTGDKITLSTTDTLPDPLAASTTYYIVRVDEDTFKLATTLQNSFDDSVINLTDGGVGTHTISGNLNTTDLINGYESFVIWRTVEMMKEKEESDTTVAMTHVQRQIARIESAAGNRDAGFPQRIVDVDWINDAELRVFQETNIRYRIMGNNIEFMYIGYQGS